MSFATTRLFASRLRSWGAAGLLGTLAGVAVSPAAAALPGEPGWGTTEPCADADFRTEGADYRRMLLSRHTYCAKFLSDRQVVAMDVMRTADGRSYEPYKKNAGRPAEQCTLGHLNLETQFQSYGKGASLNTVPHKIRIKITTFDTSGRSANCPPVANTIVFTPLMEMPVIGEVGGVSNAKMSYTTPQLTTTLAPGKYDTAPIEGDLSWDAVDAASLLWLRFQPTVYQYRVQGAEPANGVEWQLTPGGASGPVVVPTMRCDKGVIHPRNGGCVFPEAAAVFVVDSAEFPEAVVHLKQAMAGKSSGMSAPAPGGFKLLNGTRAIGIEGNGSEPMQRANKAELTENRYAACGSGDSLIATREPVMASDSCEGSRYGAVVDGCSCDEYPFASTRSGANFYGHATSVKYIRKKQNQDEGSSLSTFYTVERVVAADYDGSQVFWVITK
jgi:Deoxyribonuclease NucA/NucB